MADSKGSTAASTQTTEVSTDDGQSALQNDQLVHSSKVSSNEEATDAEAQRTLARAFLTPAEEKKLLRRIDWHLMPLCSLIFMFKNLDADNVSGV